MVSVSAEYNKLPDELIHQTRFSAKDGETPFFDASFPAYQLSNHQIGLTYEPETVEDQEIINSYGGLDNTPCYLVRLRPVLTVDGERLAVGLDGLPMGADYTLTIDLQAPNGTHQEVVNTPTPSAIFPSSAWYVRTQCFRTRFCLKTGMRPGCWGIPGTSMISIVKKKI